jgi:hypothetical protein
MWAVFRVQCCLTTMLMLMLRAIVADTVEPMHGATFDPKAPPSFTESESVGNIHRWTCSSINPNDVLFCV